MRSVTSPSASRNSPSCTGRRPSVGVLSASANELSNGLTRSIGPVSWFTIVSAARTVALDLGDDETHRLFDVVEHPVHPTGDGVQGVHRVGERLDRVQQVVDGTPELLDPFADRVQWVHPTERTEQFSETGYPLSHGGTVPQESPGGGGCQLSPPRAVA